MYAMFVLYRVSYHGHVHAVLVASNANIGGPGTAGSFASMIGRPALVFPAAVWGTVGYAIASTIGIKVWQILSKV